MHRRPEELREIATRCRFLASSCITDAARRPLNEMADELEEAADAEQQMRIRQPVGSGRC
jgi:hypothetical protein